MIEIQYVIQIVLTLCSVFVFWLNFNTKFVRQEEKTRELQERLERQVSYQKENDTKISEDIKDLRKLIINYFEKGTKHIA
jgi:hypothetical protein